MTSNPIDQAARIAMRARKALAYHVAHADDHPETSRAYLRAARRERAARRHALEALRFADLVEG